jgi:hypothetical protein
MHLLQAGVDIAVIALWLGHESIETTHVYLEADLAAKERALQKLTPGCRAGVSLHRGRPAPGLSDISLIMVRSTTILSLLYLRAPPTLTMIRYVP